MLFLPNANSEAEVEACTVEEEVLGLSDDSMEDANYISDTVSERLIPNEIIPSKSVIVPSNEFEIHIPHSEVTTDVYNVPLARERSNRNRKFLHKWWTNDVDCVRNKKVCSTKNIFHISFKVENSIMYRNSLIFSLGFMDGYRLLPKTNCKWLLV